MTFRRLTGLELSSLKRADPHDREVILPKTHQCHTLIDGTHSIPVLPDLIGWKETIGILDLLPKCNFYIL